MITASFMSEVSGGRREPYYFLWKQISNHARMNGDLEKTIDMREYFCNAIVCSEAPSWITEQIFNWKVVQFVENKLFLETSFYV